MADQVPRGRGRRRGRGRAQAAVPAPAPAPAPALGQAEPAAAAAPAQQAAPAQAVGKGRKRAAAAPVVPPPVAGGHVQGAVQQNAGDLSIQVGQLAIAGGNQAEGSQGRGTVRPARERGPILITKPDSALTCKQGKEGAAIALSANYFELNMLRTNWTLCKHHVDFRPEEDRTWVKKILFKQHESEFEGHIFDGSMLFSVVNACSDGRPRELVSTFRQGKAEDGSDILKQYTLTLKFVGTIEPTDYQYLHIFNLLCRGFMGGGGLNLQLMKRNYFDAMARIPIPEYRLEVWPGYATSVLQCEQKVMLQCEIKYKYKRQDTVYEEFKKILQNLRPNEDIKVTFSNAIVGQVVMTTYNEKTYSVDDIDFSKTPRSTFPLRGRRQTTNVSYADYVNEKYGLRCTDFNQPMLISRSNARQQRAGQSDLLYLIPEFCLFTGLTDEMKRNFQLMRRVSEVTRVGPSARIQRLLDFNKRLTNVPTIQTKLESWGLKLEPNLVEFRGRILPSETISVDGGSQHDAGSDANWDRILRNSKMIHDINLENWVVIFPSRARAEAREFCSTLKKVSHGMKHMISEPTLEEFDRESAAEYIRALTNVVNRLNPKIVLCILTRQDAVIYSAIKRRCILEKPMPSQVILKKNMVGPKAMSVATKLIIQMNCKMGGVPWGVSIPVAGLMTIGYDVCHVPREKNRSYAAMVASLDIQCVRWYSNVSHHSAGEELSTNFAFNVMKAIAVYRKRNNGALPVMLIIYRDGVGEGQIDQVLSVEVENIKKEVGPLYEAIGKRLRMAFVIVTKRINTRIFMKQGNPPPGTIVDSTITSPFKYDFYLVSQMVRQGTVTPTYYNVIEDTTNLKPDHLQRLTYKFTHLYFNWSGTVRVPAPCQYAHKLALLTAENVMSSAQSNIDQTLYFL